MKQALVAATMMDDEGRLLPAFEPNKRTSASLPESVRTNARRRGLLASTSCTATSAGKSNGDPTSSEEILADAQVKALWERIKPRTSYRVEFDTELLIGRCAQED
ncbi:MAG: hypothetical protein R2817_05705 [Flavobacteriales bacterium]